MDTSAVPASNHRLTLALSASVTFHIAFRLAWAEKRIEGADSSLAVAGLSSASVVCTVRMLSDQPAKLTAGATGTASAAKAGTETAAMARAGTRWRRFTSILL